MENVFFNLELHLETKTSSCKNYSNYLLIGWIQKFSPFSKVVNALAFIINAFLFKRLIYGSNMNILNMNTLKKQLLSLILFLVFWNCNVRNLKLNLKFLIIFQILII